MTSKVGARTIRKMKMMTKAVMVACNMLRGKEEVRVKDDGLMVRRKTD